MKFTINKNLFHIKDKGYVITDDSDITFGCQCVNTAVNSIYEAGEIELDLLEQFPHRKATNKRIIATDSTFKLEFIPQFEILTQDDTLKMKANKIVESAIQLHEGVDTPFTEKEQHIMFASWLDGYKECQSDGAFLLSDLKLLAKEIESGRKSDWCKIKSAEFGDYARAEAKWWENFICSTTVRQLVAIEVETEDNQCDGCNANLPLEGNIHKDDQSLGIACSKDRYNKPKIHYTEPQYPEGILNVTNCIYERIR